MMGTKERAFGPLPPVIAGGPGPAGPLLPAPGAHARPGLRPRPGPGRLRRHRPPLDRPGRLLQAAADPLLRGAALRAPAHAGGGRPAQPALVPRLRPDRAAARPLQPDPHPRALRAGRSSAASSRRSSSSASRRGWSGARSSTSTRPRSRPTPRSIRSGPASPSRRTSPGSSPRRRRAATVSDGSGGPAERRRRRTGAVAGRADGGGAGRPGRARRRTATTGSGEAGRPDRDATSGAYRRTADFRASTTDPDATPLPTGGRAHAPGLPGPLRRRRRQGPDHPDRLGRPRPRCRRTSRRSICSGGRASAGSCGRGR